MWRERQGSSEGQTVEETKDSRFNTNTMFSAVKDTNQKSWYEERATTSIGYSRKIPTLLNRSIFNSKEMSEVEKSRNA